MDVGGNDALRGDPARLLVRAGEALLAQPLHGLRHVALRLHERLLCVHHARARLVAQCFRRLGIHLELRGTAPSDNDASCNPFHGKHSRRMPQPALGNGIIMPLDW